MSIASRLCNKLVLKGLSLQDAKEVTKETLAQRDAQVVLELHDRTPHDDKPEIHRIEVLIWILADTLLERRGL